MRLGSTWPSTPSSAVRWRGSASSTQHPPRCARCGSPASRTCTTSRPSTGSRCRPSMSSPLAIRASRSATPAQGKAPMTNATCGPTSQTPFAFYDPDSSCWRTSQGTFPLDSMSSSVTWPRSGSMRTGRCYERPTSAPVTDVPACSSLLMTPTVEDWKPAGPVETEQMAWWAKGEVINNTYMRLRTQVPALLPTPAAGNPNDGEDLENWQRRRLEVKERHANGNGFGTPLSIAVRLLPTPVTMDSAGARNSTARRRPNSTGNIGDTLTDAVWKQHGAPEWAKTNMLPTPTARDWKGQNQRKDSTCLPGAITALPSTDTPLSSDDELPGQLTIEGV